MSTEKKKESCEIHRVKSDDVKNGFILGCIIAFAFSLWIYFGEQISSIPILSFFSIEGLSTGENVILLVIWSVLGFFLINTIIIFSVKRYRKYKCLKEERNQ